MCRAQIHARRMTSLSRGTELFYILNNLYPGDPVAAGEKYKIVTVQQGS